MTLPSVCWCAIVAEIPLKHLHVRCTPLKLVVFIPIFPDAARTYFSTSLPWVPGGSKLERGDRSEYSRCCAAAMAARRRPEGDPAPVYGKGLTSSFPPYKKSMDLIRIDAVF
jgi:hypothetical protein